MFLILFLRYTLLKSMSCVENSKKKVALFRDDCIDLSTILAAAYTLQLKSMYEPYTQQSLIFSSKKQLLCSAALLEQRKQNVIQIDITNRSGMRTLRV